ncbi:hypothetical protein [Nostoc sp. PA-18-2419]|uniref:hypothetical protein n=1 Tax=Nostoc sp. PA-18-2419 TaxID=2575443 RepID=UPI0011088B4A|nr:hypothetical protein [Nostoc sp. PA-18-2419]
MEHLSISNNPTGLHIDGFPHAEKLVNLKEPQARRLADLGLHRTDLEFAADCLEAINTAPNEPLVMRQSLWRSAIIYYIKCFGDNARFQLNSSKIYKGDDQAQEVFTYFKTLRNKHLVHDENSYAQCIPGAILNQKVHPYKIEKIICVCATAETLCQENYSNLYLLIQKAKAWVIQEFDSLTNNLTQQLESEPYDDLYNRESISYTKPTIDEINRKRNVL